MFFESLLKQILYAALFYLLVVALFRFSGKRLAGQTTTFDLVILISLAVAIQRITLFDGNVNALVFLITVFLIHHGQTWLCRKYPLVRDFVRGRPTRLIKDGKIDFAALEAEGLTLDELKAGLRKTGTEKVDDVKTAHLEETGQISAIKS